MSTIASRRRNLRRVSRSGKVPSFRTVWMSLQETDRQMKETDRKMQETDRQFKERVEQYEREKKARDEQYEREKKARDEQYEREKKARAKQYEREKKETDRIIGELGNRFGELVEHLVVPSINEKFNEMGFTFETISQNLVIKDSSKKCLAEIDILLENGDTVIAVEVKSRPLQKDVEKFVEKMGVLRNRADIRRDERKYQGAIAGAVMNNEVRDYAHKTGFYVIEQTGDTVMINIPPNFKPREW